MPPPLTTYNALDAQHPPYYSSLDADVTMDEDVTPANNDDDSQIPSPTRAHLLQVGAENIEFKNVRLDLTTQFTLLAQVTLAVRVLRSGEEQEEADAEVQIEAYVDQIWHGSASLHDFIDRRAEQITDPQRAFTQGKAGFSLADLESVAGLFVARPSGPEGVEAGGSGGRGGERYGQYHVRGEWESLGENVGYVHGLN
ncbi:hypothetical protein B0A55_08624 [Friedmanniomyces simplex]|uniref:Uncharacterized protein n=1 Tax=Friedmanniomyces simplex TaxID=329884 RepID=A0A4U0WT88_9PEZI|nr:hypothetical protein B0A55_08624 [Friedmanniomyces simplex]